MSELNVELAWWVSRAINDERSKLLAVTAGLGSGKSHGAVQWEYQKILDHPAGRYWFYMMPLYELIHNTAIPKTQKVYEGMGMLEGPDYSIVKSPYPKLIFQKTKQEIHFISGSRPDKIKSVEYAGGVVDEPGVTPAESVKRIRERVRDKGGALQILFPGTPEGMNHFAEEFNSDGNPGWQKTRPRDHELVRVADDEEIWLRRFRLSTYDNQHNLPAGYIADILDTHRANPAYIQAYIHGYFVPLITGGCYTNYRQQKHDCADGEPDPNRTLDLTWDFNANPLAWVSVQKIPVEEYGRRRFCFTAFYEADQNAGQLDDAVAEFAWKHPVEKFSRTQIRLFGDRSGHAGSHKISGSDYDAIRNYLKELGYKNIEICAARKVAPEAESVEAVQRLFSCNILFICKRCRNLRRSLTATKWKEGIRKIDKPAGERHTHHSDALKYWAWQETRGETGAEINKIYGLNV